MTAARAEAALDCGEGKSQAHGGGVIGRRSTGREGRIASGGFTGKGADRGPVTDPNHSVHTFFLVCTLLGGVVLLVQLVFGALGLGHHDADFSHEGIHGGLDLLSIRALSAGVAMFGLGGLIGSTTPLGAIGGLVLGTVMGVGTAAGVAYLMRSMLRLEGDGTLRMENAIGATASVYLTIPAGRQGAGKVHVTVQGRTVEVAAVTAHGQSLPTGASVVVIDVAGSDVLEVAPEAAILPTEVTHAAP